MALFKKAEFAAYCEVSKPHVSMALKRGKLVETDDGRIDTENTVNQAFIAHCKDVAAKREKPLENPELAPEARKKAKREPKPEPQPKTIDPEVKKRVDDKFDTEIKEKQARTSKLERELRLLELKEMKQTGQVIPTDLVANTIRQLMQSVMVAFSDASDAFINDMAKSLKIDREKMALIRKQMKNIVNGAVNRAVDDAQKNVNNIVQEHSQGKAA